MAALSTTAQKLGINGLENETSGSLVGFSTATSSLTITCGSLEDVVIWYHNPSGATDVTATISASTAEGYASIGRGDKILSTAIGSSDYGFIANLESNWFQSTSNAFTVTFSTAIAAGFIELSSTRQN